MSSMRRNTRTSQSPRISLLERIWSVEDQDLLMVFEIQLVEGCRHSVMDSAGCERSRCGHITVQRSHYGTAVTLRYRVDRFTLNCAAMSCTGTSFERSSVRMVFSSLGLSFFGRPPLRPRARAALRPASVRSRIKLRSNSAFCGAPQKADDAERAIMQSHTAEVAVWPAVS